MLGIWEWKAWTSIYENSNLNGNWEWNEGRMESRDRGWNESKDGKLN